MAAIDNLIKVNISNQTGAVAQPGFSVPLIVGATATGWAEGDAVHTYTDAASMLTDGFTSTAPEYLAAVSMMSQNIVPTQFKVGMKGGSDLATGLTAIMAQDNTWYGVCLAGLTDDDILEAAPWVESNKKLLVASSFASDIATSVTSDLASELQTAGYHRTGLFYTANENGILEAALLGSQLAMVPGSNNWAYKNLSGVSGDTLSENAKNILLGSPVAGTTGKSANIYVPVGGLNITQMGTAASGRFFDITVGIDWLQSNLQTDVFAALSSVAKVPYTDVGVSMLMQIVRTRIDIGVSNGLIDGKSDIIVTAPSINNVTANQRAHRIAPTITFQCRLQGALNAVLITGTVTV